MPKWLAAWKPKPRRTLTEWSIENARLSDGSRYKPFPFQVAIADAFTEPGVTQITVKKSSRIGYSQIVQNYVGYCIDQDPARLLIYQPTIDDAEGYSKDDLDPVLRWPVIRRRLTFKPRDVNNQVRAKRFPGGWVQIKGSNSPKEFSRVTADKVLLEEPDGYPQTAGVEGDPADLAYKRCLTSDEPLKAAGSTPTVEGGSRIDKLFQAGTQEHRYVPCPHCGTMQVLVFGDGAGPGLRWEPKDRPTRAWYQCVSGCEIEETDKAWMDEQGEWRAHAPENYPHRSFHIWAAYSQFRGAAWLEIAKEFREVYRDPNRHMVFVNQVLGLTWAVKGEAPQWRRLYDRREEYRPGVVPRDALLLTAGLDVQKNRVEIFVWGWGRDRQSWLIDHHVIEGDPFKAEIWAQASEYVQATWPHEGGATLRLAKVGADTGFATTQVEQWARRHPGLVIPVKGAATLAAPVFAWSDVREAAPNGGKRKRGMRLGMVGGHTVTLELYGLLNLDPPTDEDAEQGVIHPAGYVHLSKLASEETCKQLTGDQWMQAQGKWRQVHATEALDCWKYARAVLAALGADRWSPGRWAALATALGVDSRPEMPVAPPLPVRAAVAPADPPLGAPPPAPEPPRAPQAPRPGRKVGRGGYLSRIGR